MPRAFLIRSPRLPYHVYARSNNREWFSLPTDAVWEIFQGLWNEAVIEYGVQLHVFVLMSNHFHAVLTTPNENIDEIMHHILREAARRINQLTGRINHVFGGTYKWSIIESRSHYKHVVRYVYQNPVKAGICKRVEDYPFSTIADWQEADPTRRLFPVSDSIFDKESVLDLSISQKIEWLNQTYSSVKYDALKKALKRSRFKTRQKNLPRVAWANLNS